MIKYFAFIFSFLCLGACIERKGPLAPFEIVERGKRLSSPSPTRAASADVIQGENQTIIIKKGDTLFALSRAYGVPTQYIIEENNLMPPYALQPGQTLTIPANKLHVVQEGETLYNISRMHGVNMWSLATFNNLHDPFIVKVGQSLKLPGRMQRLKKHPKGPQPLEKEDVSQKEAPQTLDKETLKKIAPAPRSDSKFLSPVSGKIISMYGPRQGGLQNDGINIAAPKGTPIKAAENGVVVYTGDGIKSFGNLVLVKHSDGWVSAYGHVNTISVKKGDHVVRGQDIATVGATGHVDTPQLHFELRKGTKTINPAEYI